MSPPPLDIVILGGSYAGLAVAHNFLNSIVHQLNTFEGAPTYRIVLISPSTHVYWNICAPRALVSPNLISLEDAFIPIQPALARHKHNSTTFMHGRATGIDTSARKVMVEMVKSPEEKRAGSEPEFCSSLAAAVSNITSVLPDESCNSNAAHKNRKVETLQYHALILATGSFTHSPMFSLHETHEETLAELNAFHCKIESAHSVLIVGAGPTGVETAGQLATHYNQRSRWSMFRKKSPRSNATMDLHALTRGHKMLLSPLVEKNEDCNEKRDSTDSAATVDGHDGSFVQISKRDSDRSSDTTQADIAAAAPPPHALTPKHITLISGSTRLLPHLAPSISAKAEKKLKKQGVHIIHHVREVSNTLDANGSTTSILNNDTTLISDVHISATGASPNTAFLPKELINRWGFVKTDSHTLRVQGHGIGERIYAVGDCASYSRGNLADVYRAVPVLMRNLRNDLLEHELKLQTIVAVPPSIRTTRLVSALESGAKARYGNAAMTPKEVTPQKHSYRSITPSSSLSPIREDVPHTSSRCVSATSMNTRISTPKPFEPSVLPEPPLLTPEEAAKKAAALEDVHYTQIPSDTYLMPTSRFGGVGVIWDVKVPGWVVYLLKGRRYRLNKASRAVMEGRGVYRLGV
jgi:NADH dehydrogenase FAD-containing subunit